MCNPVFLTMNRYVFDLDNTLVHTNLLNNNSYNYALNQLDLEPIYNCRRITRDVVFMKYPQLNDNQKKKIVEIKQEFFITNIKDTKPNKPLLKILKSQNVDHCLLWTSADKTRVNALLEYYKLFDAFKKILFSSKINVLQDIEKICRLFGCGPRQLVFYEDNLRTIEDINELNLNVITI